MHTTTSTPLSIPRLHKPVVILGAGPAGLTAAYELVKHGAPVCVIEQDPQYVGGIARTVFLKVAGGRRPLDGADG